MSHTELRKTSSLCPHCPQQRPRVADRDAASRLREAILSLAIGTGLLVPVSAFVYLTPEQVFGGGGLTLQPAPPTQREGSDVVAARQQQSATRRAEEQKSLRSEGTPPAPVHAPYDPSPRNLLDDATQYNLRMQRKQTASPATQVIIVGPRGEVRESSGNVLRSSASLVTSTGPETVLAAILMMLATLSTLAYVQYRSRTVAVAL